MTNLKVLESDELKKNVIFALTNISGLTKAMVKFIRMIQFMTEGVGMPDFDISRVCRWIEAVVNDHGFDLGPVTYNFCDDERILYYNRQFVQHDYYTDIITFDYDSEGVVSGDIVISLDTVRSNADKFGVTFDDELVRVIIHGILHLCGIDDKGPGEREIMEAEENKALKLYENLK